MKTVFSDRHEMQRVETEFYRGKWVEAFEIPRRALLVLDAVRRADLGPIVEPESFDLAPVLAVHDPDFVRFLQNIWVEWVAEVGPIPAYPNIWPPRRTRMIPTVRPGAELGRYAVDMSSPILEGTWQAARAAVDAGADWDVLGFVDDNPELEGTLVDDLRVLGPIEFARDSDAAVVVCTGRPDNYFSRKRLVRRLGLPSGRYATVVHPSAALASDTVLGEGSVLLAGVVATAAVSIGSHVAVMPQTVLTHDDRVSDFATVASGVRLGGGVTVDEGAYVGAGALVRQGLRIGDWSLLGMGSVALESVPAAEVWVGVPARKLREVEVPDVW